MAASKSDNEEGPRRRLSPAAELLREALKHEKTTPEGVANMVTLALIVVALIAGPIISGMLVKVAGDAEGWTFEVRMGDVAGGLGWLVLVSVICLIFVGGTNILRKRGLM
jgi:hypothetical protein